MKRIRIGIGLLYALLFFTVSVLMSCVATADVPAPIASERKRVFAAQGLVPVLDQPHPQFRDYSVHEISARVPVGEFAMKMAKLRGSGHDREFVEASVKKGLDGDLALWITPLAELIFSKPEESSETVVKEAIRFCLRTMKWHNKLEEGVYL